MRAWFLAFVTSCAAGVVEFTIQREPLRGRLTKRDTRPLDLTIDNLQSLYFLNASVGTPGQRVRLHVDTGSSDLWVNSDTSSFCSSTPSPCTYSGTYSANRSSSYRFVNSDFNISYADGSGAAGDYVTDTLRVSGAELADFQMGVGYDSSASQNIVGIGYRSNEALVMSAGGSEYDNLPAALAAQGVIASNAYSLWLDDLDSSTGRLLFGGVDTSRFRGKLVTLPVQKPRGSDTYTAFYVTLTRVVSEPDGAVIGRDMRLAVLLDSGTSLTYLPDIMARDIYERYNASYDSSQGVALIDCDAPNGTDASLNFTFSRPASVSVPLSELVLGLEGVGGQSGGNTCLFGIAPSGGSTAVLGDTFLRSAYVVYDLDRNEVGVAQSDVNGTRRANVVEISREGALPSSVRAPDPVTAESGLPSPTGGESAATRSRASWAYFVALCVPLLL